MKLFQIGDTELRLHPGLIAVLGLAVVFGMLSELLQAFLALILHEVFHAIVARGLGYRVYSVEMLPFGGVARLGDQHSSSKNEFIIAIAGPLCNFVVAGFISVAVNYYPGAYAYLRYFMQANLVLAVFNLLPALPLDGGRMLRSILHMVLRPRAATLIAAWIGIALGLALLAMAAYLVTFGLVNPFLWIMGAFLPMAAIRELRALPQAQLHAMLKRKDALMRGEAVSMRQVAVRKSLSAGAALRQLSASKYNLLLVLDDDLRVVGQVDEGALLLGIAKHGQRVTVGEIAKSP